MFKYKKHTIYFRRAYNNCLEKATDAYLISCLLDLQKDYDFQLISLNLADVGVNSITIKNKKEDTIKIFTAFCIKLNCYIEDTRF